MSITQAITSTNLSPRHFNRALNRFTFVLGIVMAATAIPASAQTITGPFAPFNSWWIHPTQGTGGVSRDSTSIFIDRDGDGLTDATYNIPNLGAQPFPINIVLSPTRDVLLAFNGACPGGGSPVYFFDTTTPPNLTIIDNACIENGIGDIGFYDTFLCSPTGVGGVGLVCPPVAISPQRVAYVRDANNQGRNQVYWFDLVSGEHRTTFPGFNRGFPFHKIHVSPFGDVAFVQHGATGSSPPSSDYTLVNLCPGPGFGTALSSNVGGALFNILSPAATAEMIQSGSDYFVRITHPDLIGGSDDIPFAPCGSGVPPEELGACCFAGGTCSQETVLACDALNGKWSGPGSDCADCDLPGACCFATSCTSGLTEDECNLLPGATWLGALTSCTNCDILDLDITKSASLSSVQEGTNLEYTLSYSNVGDLDATGVTITDVIPNGSNYVSSSNGGTFNSATRTVTWSIPGTLAPGASGFVTLQVRANCGITTLINSNYRIIAGGTPFSGSPAVSTPVSPANAQPLSFAVSSVPARTPLQRGDLITHTFVIEETSGVARTGLNFSCGFGSEVSFDAVTNAGGGAATPSGSQLNWTGNVAAGATINVIFTTRVTDCAVGSSISGWLNNGNPIQLRNACAVALATTTPPGPFEILTPIRAEMFALPPIGAPQSNSISSAATQVCRPGATLDIQILLTNQLPDAQPSVSTSVVIPADLTPVGNPPFIAPTDGAATYDDATRRISWTGAVAGNSSIQITFQVTVATGGACRFNMLLNGQTGACNDISFGLTLLVVPEPPAESHLLGLSANSGFESLLWTFRPGIDTLNQRVLCIGHEIHFSMTRTPGGDIWVMGLPMYRINPTTLDFEIFRDDLAESFGIQPFGYLTQVAHDPSDGSMLLAGSNQGVGNGHLKIVRYNPTTQAWAMIFDGATLTPPVFGDARMGIVVDADGRVATVAFFAGVGSRIIRFDPADPAAYQVYVLPNVPSPSAIALAADGNYLASNYSFGTQPLVIAHVDRTLGTETVLVPDLTTLNPAINYLLAMSQAPDGLIYASAATNFAELAIAIDVDPTPSLVPLTAGLSVDVQWVDLSSSPPVPGDLDGDGDVDADDYARFVAAFGSNSGDPNFDPEADMDADGDVDCADLVLFRAEWDVPMHPRFPRCLTAQRHSASPTTGGPPSTSRESEPAAASPIENSCGAGISIATAAGISPLVLATSLRTKRRQNRPKKT